MNLRYYYSSIGNLIFCIFGLVLLFVGIDFIFLHKLMDISNYPSKTISFIPLLLGILVFTGFLKNILSGKKYLIEVDDNYIKINIDNKYDGTKSLNIKWDDIKKIETKNIRSVFSNSGGARSSTTALSISFKPNSVELPKSYIGHNRILFNREDNEIIIDAWLNKSKEKIVKEIIEFGKDTNKLNVEN